MSKTIVALDCMGGDNAPFEIVKGAVEATNENKDILVKLVGVEEQIKEELSKYKYNSDQLEIVNATEIIETAANSEIKKTPQKMFHIKYCKII